ncbi:MULTISPECIES: DUF4230 domain-containing protein [Sphingomonas]|uniref:DUF4230 domain-containing protein n=1 Tax=Sphingomonas TaxID=13687 RepID=UPI001269CC88|nr:MULTISPECIES: DUF4230 domain-containing protein [Sphingomonas]
MADERVNEAGQLRSPLGLLLAVIVIVALVLTYRAGHDKAVDEGANVKLERIAVALREPRNALQVYRLSGDVRTTSNVKGGPFELLEGRMTVTQPWSVAYFVDMRQLGLDDYIWDPASRTLRVRVPEVTPDAPNVDASRRKTDLGGLVITRTMQEQMSQGVAVGARRQAQAEALKPENLAAAREQARKAVAANLRGPLEVATGEPVNVEVIFPADGRPAERWDVSRSIEEVLGLQKR